MVDTSYSLTPILRDNTVHLVNRNGTPSSMLSLSVGRNKLDDNYGDSR